MCTITGSTNSTKLNEMIPSYFTTVLSCSILVFCQSASLLSQEAKQNELTRRTSIPGNAWMELHRANYIDASKLFRTAFEEGRAKGILLQEVLSLQYLYACALRLNDTALSRQLEAEFEQRAVEAQEYPSMGQYVSNVLCLGAIYSIKGERDPRYLGLSRKHLSLADNKFETYKDDDSRAYCCYLLSRVHRLMNERVSSEFYLERSISFAEKAHCPEVLALALTDWVDFADVAKSRDKCLEYLRKAQRMAEIWGNDVALIYIHRVYFYAIFRPSKRYAESFNVLKAWDSLSVKHRLANEVADVLRAYSQLYGDAGRYVSAIAYLRKDGVHPV